jgi:putative phosphoesterase
MTVLGVIADTHVPDRVARLNPRAIEVFRQAGVKAILHAGDVSVPRVLEELEQIAPVYAVRGNRDIFSLRYLPIQVRLNIEGVSIGMAHGHGTFRKYMSDKFHWVVYGALVERYVRRMLETFPDVDVIVFGHLHVPCRLNLEGKLIFNPGSASHPQPREHSASVGLLHIEQGKEPEGEIIELDR